jgi:DNA excision repair protein ERCC-8
VETATWYPFDTGMCLTSGGDRILKIWDTNSMTPVDDFEFSQIVNDHHMSSVARAHSLVAVATESTRIKLVDLKVCWGFKMISNSK